MLLISTALALGFVHGLGADHLMAIAAISVGGAGHAARPGAFGIALRFALGHAVLLVAGTGVVFVLDWNVPLFVERSGEVTGGCLLIALGAAGLLAALTGRVYGHSHPHGDHSHTHWHLHIGRPDRHPLPSAHSHMPTILGTLFAVGGLRALTLLVPFGGGGDLGDSSVLALLGLVVIFAFGVLLSMCVFGVVLAHAMSSHLMANRGHLMATTTAVTSVGLGVYWIIA